MKNNLNKPILFWWKYSNFIEIGGDWKETGLGLIPDPLLSFSKSSYHLSGLMVSEPSIERLDQLNAVLQIARLIADKEFRKSVFSNPTLLEKKVAHVAVLKPRIFDHPENILGG